jgi:ferredoxin--NADP+ reductase
VPHTKIVLADGSSFELDSASDFTEDGYGSMVDMMETVCGITKESGIATRVMIYPVMVDCAGMCGSCRIRVGGKTVLGCVDGPEFNGHHVDFQDLKIRMNAFTPENAVGFEERV